MDPATIFPGGLGINLRMEREVTLFPEPDSPTMASVSFSFGEGKKRPIINLISLFFILRFKLYKKYKDLIVILT